MASVDLDLDAKRMARHPAPAILLTLALLAGLPAVRAASDESPAQHLAIKVERGTLSVDVRDAPLVDVLRAIGAQTAVRITIHGGGAGRVTQSFSSVGVDEGIQRLAQGYDVVLIYGAAPGRGGARRLAEVRVYEVSAAPVTAVVDMQQRPARLQAVRNLTQQARQQQPGALASLTQMLAGDADPVVRQSVAAALGSIRGAEAVRALTAAFGDQDPSVRARALFSLGQMREEGSAGTMAQVLARDPDPSVRRAAVWALSSLQSEDAHRGLQAAASDSDPSVRQAALGALRQWERRAAR